MAAQKKFDLVAAIEENIAFEKAKTEARWAWQRACVKHMVEVLRRENLLDRVERVDGNFYVKIHFKGKRVILEMNTHDHRDLDPNTIWGNVLVVTGDGRVVHSSGSVAKCVESVKDLLGNGDSVERKQDPVAAVEADIALEKTRVQDAWDRTRAYIKHVANLLEKQDLLRHVTDVDGVYGVNISFRYGRVALRVSERFAAPDQWRACVLLNDYERVDMDGDLSDCVDRVKALISKSQSLSNE